MIKSEYKIIYLDKANKYKSHRYWVIRTMEQVPRFIEVIAYWNGVTDYGLVYNINLAKVYKNFDPPYRTADKFVKATGIKCCFQEVDEKAFLHYKSYEAYFNGERKLTKEEKKKLKEELEEYKRKIYPKENRKEKEYE